MTFCKLIYKLKMQSAMSSTNNQRFRRPRGPRPSGDQGPKMRYAPKLNVEANEEEKSVLVKVSKSHNIRSIISYTLGKIKDDWKVVLNAFGLEIGKVVKTVEIVKVRVPFLHQESKLIQSTFTRDVKTGSGDDEKIEKVEIQTSGL